jgi:hypothetical protein
MFWPSQNKTPCGVRYAVLQVVILQTFLYFRRKIFHAVMCHFSVLYISGRLIVIRTSLAVRLVFFFSCEIHYLWKYMPTTPSFSCGYYSMDVMKKRTLWNDVKTLITSSSAYVARRQTYHEGFHIVYDASHPFFPFFAKQMDGAWWLEATLQFCIYKESLLIMSSCPSHIQFQFALL